MTDLAVLIRQLQSGMIGESWHNVGAVGEPAFQNSWTNYGGTESVAAFYIDGSGRVWVKGVVKSGVYGTAIFTLPSGYRPQEDLIYGVRTSGGASYVEILTNGNIVAWASAPSFLSLDGISFRTT